MRPLYARTHKRLRKRRNKLEAQILQLRSLRDDLRSEINRKLVALDQVAEAQEALEEEEKLLDEE
jgi:hypothetical protein